MAVNLAQRIGEEFKALRTNELTLKADKADVYSKSEVESKIVELAPATDISGKVDKSELTTLLDVKADKTFVSSAISELVAAAPGTLNTLNELAAALGDDPNFAATIVAQLGTKQDNTIREW